MELSNKIANLETDIANFSTQISKMDRVIERAYNV